MNTRSTACLVSVLIPVFNAERFLRQAVESALEQEETGEVLLLDDGSIDGSLALCREFERSHDRVRVIQHPDGRNHGPAATRNLLLAHCRHDVVTFLDADDYFLPGRLSVPVKILSSDNSIDAVYEAFEIFYEDKKRQEEWLSSTTLNERLGKISEGVPPEQLFEHVMEFGCRHVIWQIVARRRVYNRIPEFNVALPTEDSLALHQIIALCRLVPGRLNEPVIIHRIHDENLYAGTPERNPEKARLVWLAWTQAYWEWALQTLTPEQISMVRLFLIRHVRHSAPLRFITSFRPGRIFYRIHRLIGLVALPFYYRRIWKSKVYWFSLVRACLGI